MSRLLIFKAHFISDALQFKSNRICSKRYVSIVVETHIVHGEIMIAGPAVCTTWLDQAAMLVVTHSNKMATARDSVISCMDASEYSHI